MREIKFRVFDNHLNKYIKDYITGTTVNLNFLFKNGSIVKGKNVLIFEQYTGLKDCNGKEIYEGDIDERGVIIWSEEYLGWFLKPFVEQFEIDLIPLYDLIFPEIIGNINENHEMLEDDLS